MTPLTPLEGSSCSGGVQLPGMAITFTETNDLEQSLGGTTRRHNGEVVYGSAVRGFGVEEH